MDKEPLCEIFSSFCLVLFLLSQRADSATSNVNKLRNEDFSTKLASMGLVEPF